MLDTPVDDIVPAQKLTGSVAAVFAARGNDFVTTAVEALDLSFEDRKSVV